MACQSLHPFSIPFLPVWSLGQKPESWTAELQRTSGLCRWKSTLKEGPKTGRRGREGDFHNNAPAPQPTQDTVCLYQPGNPKPQTFRKKLDHASQPNFRLRTTALRATPHSKRKHRVHSTSWSRVTSVKSGAHQ